ncbi:MAG TPA: CDGSH iron-sulfur domain-containing protein [Acidimicrobiia bacterium]|nr:CDGSH iron-sulfur domain-containing protein [Acidimicrobiia bacterium]
MDCEDDPVDVSRSVVALCRCGRSANAPLCDGSHRAPRRARSSRKE